MERRGIRLIAASADNIEDARKMEQEFKVTFMLGYDLNVREWVQKSGGYFHAEKGFAHPADFIIRPNGEVATALYSSGALGRYTAFDVIEQLDYLIKKETEGIHVSATGQIDI